VTSRRRLPPKADRRALLRARGWTQLSYRGSECWIHPYRPHAHYTLAAAYRAEAELGDAGERRQNDVAARALNAAATAARETVLEFALRYDRREDYLPLEHLAARVQRSVLEAGAAAIENGELELDVRLDRKGSPPT
jgi:hypothetical protein